ncbi:MAG: hypothetical protein JWQ69_4891, partial [Pseudomonas sp.]|nr:hypothetical protein [Pseudomonas sp.]
MYNTLGSVKRKMTMNRIFAVIGISLIAMMSPMLQAANLKTLDVAALP